MTEATEFVSRVANRAVVQHAGRIFNIGQRRGRLVISEITFDRQLDVHALDTALSESDLDSGSLCACSLGDLMLVLAERSIGSRDGFAALLFVGSGPLTQASVRVTTLQVRGWKPLEGAPYLSRFAEGLALLHFHGNIQARLCEVGSSSLTIRQLPSDAPALRYLVAPLVRLSDGQLLAVWKGAQAQVSGVSLKGTIICQLRGYLPRECGHLSQAAVIADRFLIGFGNRGGKSSWVVWVFDLQTGKSTLGRQCSEINVGKGSCLLTSGDCLHLFGGSTHLPLQSFPLQRIASGLEDATIAAALLPAALRLSISSLEASLQNARTEAQLLRNEVVGLRRKVQAFRPPKEDTSVRTPVLERRSLHVLALPIARFQQVQPMWRQRFQGFLKALEMIFYRDVRENQAIYDEWDCPELLVDPKLWNGAPFWLPLSPDQVVHRGLVAQISTLLSPGRFVSAKLLSEMLVVTFTQRQQEKLVDLEATGEFSCKSVTCLSANTSKSDCEASPILFSAARTLFCRAIKKYDPLMTEVNHKCSLALKRGIRASKTFLLACRQTGLDSVEEFSVGFQAGGTELA